MNEKWNEQTTSDEEDGRSRRKNWQENRNAIKVACTFVIQFTSAKYIFATFYKPRRTRAAAAVASVAVVA